MGDAPTAWGRSKARQRVILGFSALGLDMALRLETFALGVYRILGIVLAVLAVVAVIPWAVGRDIPEFTDKGLPEGSRDLSTIPGNTDVKPPP